MLIVISDLHLTDGTTGTTIGAGAFEDFQERITALAIDASWRDQRDPAYSGPRKRNKVYRPIAGYDIVLLGDILDIIRSTRWTDNDSRVRPWPDPALPDWPAQFAVKVEEILDAILAHNCEALSHLRRLTAPQPPRQSATAFLQHGGRTVHVNYTRRAPIRIPAATADGRPNYQAPYVEVPARIHYIVGNHDWFLVRPGAVWNRLRAKVVETFGLTQDPEQPFPHNLLLEPRHRPLVQTCLAHRVFLRHGDAYDEFNYNREVGTRDAATLGDALVIELINRFPGDVERALAAQPGFNPALIAGLREIDNVRPLEALPAWLNSLLERYRAHGMDKQARSEVQRIWNQLVDNLLASPFVRSQDSRLRPGQPVDRLQLLLRASKLVSIERLDTLLEAGQFLMRAVSDQVDVYARAAAAEPWLRDGRASFVVYGHTHEQRVVPLDRRLSAAVEDRLLYFNSGTWKQVHELAQFSEKGPRFVDYAVMTYVAFFRGDERGGRPFETWSGTLANRPE